MTDETTPKGLTVIEGGRKGKGLDRTGTKATPTGLTEKQERFAQGLAEGLTNSEAYRADTAPKT